MLKKIKTEIRFKKPILALGGQLKAGFCVAKDKSLFVNNSFGDLEDPKNLELFEKDLRNILKNLKITPRVIAYDLHPEYLTTKLAKGMHEADMRIKLIGIQHHHAHIASCYLEHNLKGPVIGICFDGTGFGADGTLWGAEFLVADLKGYKRIAHLEYVPLIGGEAAIKEPLRVAFAWLYKTYQDKISKLNIDFVKRLDKKETGIFKQMLKKEINCPPSSSMGRLFDGVSSLLGLGDRVDFEAQAAIKLEKLATSVIGLFLRLRSGQAGYLASPAGRRVIGYNYKINYINEVYVISPQPMFREIVKDLRKKVSRNEVALKFHYTIISMMRDVCRIIREKTKLNSVVLSGGVFQNRILKEEGRRCLREDGFRVLVHSAFSATDSSLCLGQAVIANNQRG
ncbi:MAG: hypothetical protein V1674_06150 [Candidatus Omnitrophota bacterium]